MKEDYNEKNQINEEDFTKSFSYDLKNIYSSAQIQGSLRISKDRIRIKEVEKWKDDQLITRRKSSSRLQLFDMQERLRSSLAHESDSSLLCQMIHTEL